MDEYIEKHFNAWCEKHLHQDEMSLNGIKGLMIEVYNGDPEYWQSEGWGKVFRQVLSVYNV